MIQALEGLRLEPGEVLIVPAGQGLSPGELPQPLDRVEVRGQGQQFDPGFLREPPDHIAPLLAGVGRHECRWQPHMPGRELEERLAGDFEVDRGVVDRGRQLGRDRIECSRDVQPSTPGRATHQELHGTP